MAIDNINNIEVTVEVSFLADQSDIQNNHYRYAYHVTVTNHGTQAAQLISRHWVITEADGELREVKGDGVIGEQPLIKPNKSYDYMSMTYFKMPTGSMHGSYQMVAEDGTHFDATIPAFQCNMPRVLH